MSNGLDALDARADRARRKTPPPATSRRVLPPQHPAPTAPPQERRSVPEVPKGQETFPGLLEPHQEAPAAPRAEVTAAVAAPASTSPTGELRKVAVYLEEGQDAALDALHYAGASRRPRLDVSKSAVVRLAMERLLSELSPEEIVEVIAARPVTGQSSGRKRR